MGARFFAPVQTGPGAHPDSCTMDTGSIPAVKRTERGADNTTSFWRRGLEREAVYLYSNCRPHRPVIGSPLPVLIKTVLCIVNALFDNLKYYPILIKIVHGIPIGTVQLAVKRYVCRPDGVYKDAETSSHEIFNLYFKNILLAV
jgi:hypothetical protein